MPPPQPPPQPALDPRQQVAGQLVGANNVLVTVSNNPSVDQLAAAIGTTLVLNKMGKHATAVFSGEVPSTIGFLQPEKTIEKTTDSLRDFIIALDKSKADKLRYKVEDKFVKIFITPYHTNLSEKDLEYSHGDYNVDVVLALGVKKKEELDQAIVAHGRILHDAAVVSVNNQAGADIGAINLNIPASSLCEIMVTLFDQIGDDKKPAYDQQIATAYLTGIVAETQRFSNAKTTPQTMSTAAKLMNAGANQQLIASKLEEPKAMPQATASTPTGGAPKAPGQKQVRPMTPIPSPDGSIKIDHNNPELKLPEAGGDEEADDIDKIHIDNEGTLQRLEEMRREQIMQQQNGGSSGDQRKVVSTPPSLGSKLSANTSPEYLDPSSDPLSQTGRGPILNRNNTNAPTVQPPAGPGQTLSDIEKSVDSTHANGASGAAPPVPPPLPMASPPPLPPNNNNSGPDNGVPL